MRAQKNTLQRSLDMLVHIAEAEEPMSIQQAAQALGMPHGSAHRILQQLAANDLVAPASERTFALGPAALRLAWRLRKGASFETLARPALRNLVDEIEETVTLNRYVEKDGVSIITAIGESSRALSYVLEVGERKHLNAGASGKVILAFLPDEEVHGIIARHGLPRATERTVVQRARLERDIAEIRAKGFALSKGERLAGAVAVAAPIFGFGERVFGSLVVTMPEQRFRPTDTARYATAVTTQAHVISELLGASLDRLPKLCMQPAPKRLMVRQG